MGSAMSQGRPQSGVALLESIRANPVVAGPARFLRGRREQVLFVVVGAWNTLFAYAEWALLQVLLQDRLHYLVILVLAWPPAVLNAYACQRHFVFRSTGRVRDELPRFSLIYLITLIGALVVLPLLLQAVPFGIYVIQAGYTIAVVAFSYLGHKFFSFGEAFPSAREPELNEDPHGES
jgi:putative flippase GtrA